LARLVDLTVPITTDHWRWPVETKKVHDYETGFPFRSSRLTFGSHCFTHVDAPKHFVPGGASLEELSLEQWFGDAAVVDISTCDANEAVTAQMLESCGGHIQAGDMVLLRTDWPRRRSIDTEAFWLEAPYTTREACDWLVARGAKTVGFDYPPDYVLRNLITEPGRRLRRDECTIHDVLLPKGIGIVEYLQNLDRLQKNRVLVAAFPLLIPGGDGSPVRAVAIET
jgi:arylformamidase